MMSMQELRTAVLSSVAAIATLRCELRVLASVVDALLGIINDTPLRTGSACNWPDRNSLNCWAYRLNDSIKSSNPWCKSKSIASTRARQ